MARYRKVDVRTYADEKFRGLSRPQPNGQSLWLYLLTGEETGPIPGLMRAGEAALAEQLGWPLEAFRRCWREVQAAGMAEADWSSRVVWLPRAIAYNEPENMNVVKGWRATWDELPECQLKARAWASIEAYMVSRDEARQADAKATGKATPAGSFAETFRQSCPKPSGNGSGNGSGNRLAFQEQEQEQEQDRKAAAAGARRRAKRSDKLGSGAAEAAPPPPAAEAAPEPGPSASPGTAEPAVALEGAPTSSPTPAAVGHSAEAATPSTPPRPVRRAAPPTEDDAPPPRKLQVLDLTDLDEFGAELRVRLQDRLAPEAWRPPVSAPERRISARAELERLVSGLGLGRAEELAWAVIQRRQRQGLKPPATMAFFVPMFEEAMQGGNPMPVEVAGVDVNQVLAARDAEVEARWAPLMARLTPSQREELSAEKARLEKEIRSQGLWTSQENLLFHETEGWLFEKWSRKAASGEA